MSRPLTFNPKGLSTPVSETGGLVATCRSYNIRPKRQQNRLFSETKPPLLAIKSPETATKSPVSETGA